MEHFAGEIDSLYAEPYEEPDPRPTEDVGG
jgi:hypothetical protein